jgi:two-component system response regulator HupR/HoxA
MTRADTANDADAEPRVRVLVIDDEPLNRDLLRRVLQAEYEIDEAEDAVQAITRLEADEFELLLCDQLMPGRSGTELAAEVRERWPDVVILLLTGYDDDPQVLDAQRRGVVDHVVPKPWTAKGLKELMRSALG